MAASRALVTPALRDSGSLWQTSFRQRSSDPATAKGPEMVRIRIEQRSISGFRAADLRDAVAAINAPGYASMRAPHLQPAMMHRLFPSYVCQPLAGWCLWKGTRKAGRGLTPQETPRAHLGKAERLRTKSRASRLLAMIRDWSTLFACWRGRRRESSLRQRTGGMHGLASAIKGAIA